MNKIVSDYINSEDSLSDIINRHLDKSQPVEVAFLKMQLLKDNKYSPNEFDEIYKCIDEAIAIGHPDEDLFLLFISNVIIFYSVKEFKNKCEIIFKISSSFNIEKYQPAMQAVYYNACAYYYVFFTTEFEKRDSYNLLALSKMPKNCPRYSLLLLYIAQIFAFNGRLQLIGKNNLAIIEKLSSSYFLSISSLLNNAIFTVNFELINNYYALMLKYFKNDKRLDLENLNYELNILKGNFEENINMDKELKSSLSYHRALINRDVESAKHFYGKMGARFSRGSSRGIFYFINYHHAFVTMRYEIIENALKNSVDNCEHYMLDFFIARYFLVKNNKELARFYYSRLLNNCEKYQAMGRLQYEMQFAFELSIASFFELTQTLPIATTNKLKNISVDTFIASETPLFGINKMIGSSKVILEIKKKIKKYANLQRSILIVGETGSGKEIVARAIHEESDLRDKPFLAINCGVLTDTLLQSELFGYESGAFTGAITAHKGIFETAEDGIVFLDEFGEMSPKLQVSLLRVLENNEILRVGGTKVRKIRCRIIAATNTNLEELISKKLFREDLYHRIKQFIISIPPLRERKGDIPELISYFLNLQNSNQTQVFSKELLAKFQEYHWPGNIRELKNEIDRIKVLCGYKPVIEIQDIDIDWVKKSVLALPTTGFSHSKPPKDAMEQMHQRVNIKKLTFADMRCQQIVALFHQYKQLTRGQIAQILQVSLLTATKDLQRLCAEGVIVKKTPTKSPRSHYFELNI